MRYLAPSSLTRLWIVLPAAATILGCAVSSTTNPPDNGGQGGTPTGGGNNTGSAGSPGGTAGTPGGGTGQGGRGGTTGNTGTGGAAGPACISNPANLINSAGWNCDLMTPVAIQGAVYPYGDGASCAYGPTSPPANICTTGSCCISGTTVVDATFAKWGCGIGVELNSSGGTPAVKSAYTGAVKCFNITLTGS